MKSLFLILIFTFLILTLFAQEPKVEKIILENSKLENLYRIDKNVYRSEQPNSKYFKELEKIGIKEVLNLRKYYSDKSKTKHTIIKAQHIRIKASEINENDIIEALKIIKNSEGSVLFHCYFGADRTGAVAAMYRIVFQGWTKQEAIDEMVNGGFGFHEKYDNIIELINNADIENITYKIN